MARVIDIYRPWQKPTAYEANIWQDVLPYAANSLTYKEYFTKIYKTFTIMLRGL